MFARRNIIKTLVAWTASAAGKPIVEADRLSVLSDEVAPDLREAIHFAKAFNLRWLELRGQGANKRNYYHAPIAEVRESATMLKDAGIGVSFLNTRFLKWHYPGTEKEALPFPELFDAYKKYDLSPTKLLDDMRTELPGSIERAHVLGTTKIRIFSFVRMPKPLDFLPASRRCLAQWQRWHFVPGVNCLWKMNTPRMSSLATRCAESWRWFHRPALG